MIVILQALGCGTTKVPVESVDEARDMWSKFRDGGNVTCDYLGASDMRGKCGNVYDDNNKMIARVHYNGRVESL